jgi:hypothetical protein
MSAIFKIKIIFEKLKEGYYYDSYGYRKPFIIAPALTGETKPVDSKCFGVLFELCNAFAVGNEDNIELNIILSQVKEKHEGWVELINGKEIHGLGNYHGESHCINRRVSYINLKDYGIDPKYIYLKKILKK